MAYDYNKYQNEWKKENMKAISCMYKKEFVDEFKESCKKQGIKQSDVFRKAMQEVIDQVKK